MAQKVVTADDLKYLEQTRQRLQQLTNNIASLKQDVLQNQLLPNWHSLQATAVILANNIQALTSHLSKNSDLLSSTVVYPTPNYPGREQEGLLGQILRKKFEPAVESWVEKGKMTAIELKGVEEEEELKTWAAEWIAERVAKYALEEAGNMYTSEEKEKGLENIRTGLRNPPKIDDDDYDDDDDDDDDDDGDGD